MSIPGLTRSSQEYTNHHLHAEIEVDANILVSLPTANAFVKAQDWAACPFASPEITLRAAQGELEVTAQSRGVYIIQNNLSFFSSKGNVIASAAVFKNGIKRDELAWDRSLQTPNSIAAASFSGILPLDTGDIIDFRLATDTNVVTITITAGILNAFIIAGD